MISRKVMTVVTKDTPLIFLRDLVDRDLLRYDHVRKYKVRLAFVKSSDEKLHVIRLRNPCFSFPKILLENGRISHNSLWVCGDKFDDNFYEYVSPSDPFFEVDLGDIERAIFEFRVEDIPPERDAWLDKVYNTYWPPIKLEK